MMGCAAVSGSMLRLTAATRACHCCLATVASRKSRFHKGLLSLQVTRTLATTTTTKSSDTKNVLVLGSSGALGSAVSQHLGRDLKMNVIGADLVRGSDNNGLNGFVALPHVAQDPSLADLTTRLVEGVGRELELLNDDDDAASLDAIVVASGGWEGDPSSANDSKEYANVVEKMLQMNLYPVIAAGQVAEQYMGEEGLFVVMGAMAALTPTPGMMGYGLSKAAAHHFVQTLGASTGKSATTKPKRQEGRKARRFQRYLDTLTAIGMLPTMIDTPANRSSNPNGEFEKWTKPMDIAEEIGIYIGNPPLRPHSGSLIKVLTTPGARASFHLVR